MEIGGEFWDIPPAHEFGPGHRDAAAADPVDGVVHPADLRLDAVHGAVGFPSDLKLPVMGEQTGPKHLRAGVVVAGLPHGDGGEFDDGAKDRFVELVGKIVVRSR